MVLVSALASTTTTPSEKPAVADGDTVAEGDHDRCVVGVDADSAAGQHGEIADMGRDRGIVVGNRHRSLHRQEIAPLPATDQAAALLPPTWKSSVELGVDAVFGMSVAGRGAIVGAGRGHARRSAGDAA